MPEEPPTATASRQPHLVEPALSRRRLVHILGVAALLVGAAWIAEVDPVALLEANARHQMWAFIAQGLPPETGRDYLLGRTLRDGLAWAVVETLAISIAGTALAVVLAIPLACTSAATITHRGPLYVNASPARLVAGRAVYRSSRAVLGFLRSVPGIVWGFLFVTAIGLGPFAGVLALAVHNAGVLGKLYADFLEETDPLTTEAVASSGATRMQAVCHGMVPQVTATMVSYTLYRWECAIRSATILGFVGAGGIGYYLVITIQRLQYQKLLTAILAVLALVMVSEWFAARLRTRLG